MLRQCDARILRTVFPSLILFDETSPHNCENCKAFHAFRTFLSRCKNLRATNCRIILYSRCAFQVVIGSLYWVYIEWYFFSLSLHMSVHILVHAVDAHQREWKLCGIPLETKPHTSTHARVKNYILNINTISRITTHLRK